MTSLVELGVAQVAVWWIAGATLIAVWWVTFGGQHRNPRHDRELGWWLWHWFTGGPLETARSYPGGGGRPRRGVRRTSRAAGRTGLAAGFVAAIYLRSGAASGTGLGTITGWGVGGAVGLAVVTFVVARAAVEWSMWRHYIQPLHWALSKSAGWPLDMRWWQVRRYIKIRPGLAENIEGVVIVCGPTFEPRAETEKKVVEIVTAKLGLRDVSVSWKREGIHRYVQFQRQNPVPERMPFSKIENRELIESGSTRSKVILGQTRGGKVVDYDLDRDAPHMLVSAATGGGKSAALVAITAQLMWHGADVTVLDYKRHSHLWLRDLPGVRYARDISEIHRTLIDLAAEGQRRNRAWDPVTLEERERGQGPVFPRHVIVCEELSSTMRKLRTHWTATKVSGDPNVSPAIQALDEILDMGRMVRMNVLSVAQRASANAVGSGDSRENYSLRILLGRYSQNTWKMLVPECDFAPATNHPGRAQVCIGATATETQMLWITEQEAQRWVIDKRGMQPRTHVPAPADAVPPGETVRERPATGTNELAGGVPAVTLWEASKDKGRGVVDLNYEALKKAAQRDRAKGEFPEPIGWRGKTPEYDPFDLQRWEPNRVRAKVSDGVADTLGNETDGVGRVDGNENESSEENVPLGGWLRPGESPRDNDRDRFWVGVDRTNPDGCWLWTGAVSGDGYGYFKVAGRAVLVHRFAYEDQIGPIPGGDTIDHLIGPGEPCTSKLCVRGDHLEAVTREENSARRHVRDKAQQGATR